ncbi:hypothetical protein [Streptomyces sp. NPDC060322]|uniref:hypothetical protein n=1 Tax=Streptomyces sp. NPDC060322 TaxID=3347097 RepID=UPI0036542A25
MTIREASPAQVGTWSAGAQLVAEHLRVPVLAGRLYLLPDKAVDGTAAYQADVAGLVKTLKRDGVDIEFALTKDARGYLSEYSADGVAASIALAVAIGVSSDGVKAAAKAIAAAARARVRAALGRSDTEADADTALVTVKIAELELGRPGIIMRGVEITGSVNQIERLAGETLSRSVPAPPPLEAATAPPELPGADGE